MKNFSRETYVTESLHSIAVKDVSWNLYTADVFHHHHFIQAASVQQLHQQQMKGSTQHYQNSHQKI